MLGIDQNNLITHLIEAYNDEHGHEKPPNFLRNKDKRAKRRVGGGGEFWLNLEPCQGHYNR
jgi:hypothetical protein